MRKFLLACWKADIKIVQLNVWNPETNQLELRRYNDDGSWAVVPGGYLPRPIPEEAK